MDHHVTKRPTTVHSSPPRRTRTSGTKTPQNHDGAVTCTTPQTRSPAAHTVRPRAAAAQMLHCPAPALSVIAPTPAQIASASNSHFVLGHSLATTLPIRTPLPSRRPPCHCPSAPRVHSVFAHVKCEIVHIEVTVMSSQYCAASK